MLLHHILFNTQCYLIVIIILVAVIGDYLVSYTKERLLKAVSDNLTHALIGGFSWALFCIIDGNYSHHIKFEIVICTLMASFIDFDHFLAAKSIYLKDATNLLSRPPLHSSTIPLLISTFLFGFSHMFKSVILNRLGLLILVAFGSHHTRDATRRGYWFAPFGSTPPIPYISYILITLLIPYLICFISKHTRIDKLYDYIPMQV